MKILRIGTPKIIIIIVQQEFQNAESRLSALCHKIELNSKTQQKCMLPPPATPEKHFSLLLVTGETKIGIVCFFSMQQYIQMVNSVGPTQTAPLGAA